MKMDWAFLKLAAAWSGGIAIVGWLPLMYVASVEAMESFLAAGVLGLTNSVLATVAIEYAFPRSNTTFLKIILGSMLARLVAMGTAVVILVEVLAFPALPLMLSLLVFYAVNLALEVHYLQKKVTLKHQP